MKDNIINLHVSLLHWNKGAYPNVWSFLDDTQKGVTIHIIDEGIDTGPILVQKEIYMDENTETLKSSYEKLHKEIQKLFKVSWNNIKNKKLKLVSQVLKESVHRIKDFKKIEILLDDKGWDILIKEFKIKYEKFKKGVIKKN
jgi:methionyl-tRNA formyltransferase